MARRVTRPMFAVGTVALLVAGAGIAAAVPGATPPSAPTGVPASPPDPVAIVESATSWLEGPAQDLADPQVGGFAFDSGFVGAGERALDGLTEVDPSADGLAALAQDAYDSLLHMKPDTPLTHALDTGHAAFTPDWDHDGVYGEAADYDHDVDNVLDVASFRYPTLGSDGSITFEGGTGVVSELKVVNSRGFILDATVWLPGDATGDLPSVVFNNGLASRQDHYYWYATSLARAGFAVLTYDPVGQGESEGTIADLSAEAGDCAGNCMDAQDLARWWVGEDIRPVDVGQQRPFLGFHDPAYVAAGGDNVRNPYAALLETGNVSMSGNSLGALATVRYLNALTDGAGYDDAARALPPLAAAVAMSIPGETRVSAPVPLLTISGDFDGYPLVAPALLGVGWADDHERMYDAVRGDRASANPVATVIIEGGVHTDQVDQAFVPSTPWGLAVTGHYAVAWLACYARGDADACARVTEPVDHLSRAFATQYDPDGSGPAANRCLRTADQASLGQDLAVVVAALGGVHAACPV